MTRMNPEVPEVSPMVFEQLPSGHPGPSLANMAPERYPMRGALQASEEGTAMQGHM